MAYICESEEEYNDVFDYPSPGSPDAPYGTNDVEETTNFPCTQRTFNAATSLISLCAANNNDVGKGNDIGTSFDVANASGTEKTAIGNILRIFLLFHLVYLQFF